MMVAPVSVVATGARTPLGMRAAAAAAVRAGVSGLGTHPFMIDQAGDPMPGALDYELDPSMMGPGRLLALAESALREACVPLMVAEQAARLRLPIYLGLPEYRPGFTEQDAALVRDGLANLRGLPIEIAEIRIATEGHAAGLAALAAASRQIELGALKACLVGGVDSYFQPDTMEWLDENRQLAGSVSRSAFVPGEGAGFCLLMAERVSEQLSLTASAQVLRAATARETKLIKTDEICLGEGLCAAVHDAVNGLSPPSRRINMIVCDINGERYRSEEWGFVCLRLARYFDDPTAYRSPAEYWGDMGAASGPLYVMLTCEAAARAYANGPATLVWASSEGGLRGAAVLSIGDPSPRVSGK